MISPLAINIRCVCIEEFVEMKKLHEKYRKQKIEGEITSAYVGADRKLYGLDKSLDKMLDKVYGDGARPIITERITKESSLPEPVLVADYADYAEMEEVAFNSNAEDYHAESKDWKVKEEPKPDLMEEELDAEEGDSYECETAADIGCEG